MPPTDLAVPSGERPNDAEPSRLALLTDRVDTITVRPDSRVTSAFAAEAMRRTAAASSGTATAAAPRARPLVELTPTESARPPSPERAGIPRRHEPRSNGAGSAPPVNVPA